MSAPQILILGAGFGGIVAANLLRERLPHTIPITLVDKESHFVIGATKPWAMTGAAAADDLRLPREALESRGIGFRRAEVTELDVEAQRVRLGDGQLSYTHLIIALGADYDMAALPGLGYAHEFYTLAGAARLGHALQTWRGGKILLVVPRSPFKCPPAPYEAILLIDDLLRKRGMRNASTLTFVTVEGAPMMTAGPEIGKHVSNLLGSRSIQYLPQKRTKSIEQGRVVLEDDSMVEFDLVIVVPPHVAPKVVRDAGLAPGGWIPVNPSTMRIARDTPGEVYAVGDVTTVQLPGRFRPDAALVLPKAGVFAEGQAKVAAARIADSILGENKAGVYDGIGFCYLETGDMHAFRGDGYFFALPHPRMDFREPDMIQYEGKIAWVDGWARRWLL